MGEPFPPLPSADDPAPAPVPAPPAAAGKGRGYLIAGGLALVCLVGGSLTAWVIFSGPVRPGAAVVAAPPPASEPPAAQPEPVPAPQPALASLAVPAPRPEPPRENGAVPRSIAARIIVPVLDEETILAHVAPVPRMFRLRENTRVFILDFPSLDMQGEAMNRIAALIEKVGQPRDRLLDNEGLARAISASGDTPATYYYGHNYRSADLERFFSLADRDQVTLTLAEQWLRVQYETAREVASGPFALLSVPAIERRVDAAMRRAILHHEIGHGHYFTRPAFAAHVQRVWRETFIEAERAAFRSFLSTEGYDPALEDVMINEAMAYMLFTPDRRFFSPAMVGLSEERLERLREALRAGL